MLVYHPVLGVSHLFFFPQNKKGQVLYKKKKNAFKLNTTGSSVRSNTNAYLVKQHVAHHLKLFCHARTDCEELC